MQKWWKTSLLGEWPADVSTWIKFASKCFNAGQKPKNVNKKQPKGSQQSINHTHWHTKINAVKYVNGHHIVFVTQVWEQTKILCQTYLHYSLSIIWKQ